MARLADDVSVVGGVLTRRRNHEYWDKVRNLESNAPYAIGSHCSGDYPVYFVYLIGTRSVAYRGADVAVMTKDMGEADVEKLRKFCELMGIPWQKPEWRMASYWSW